MDSQAPRDVKLSDSFMQFRFLTLIVFNMSEIIRVS